MGNLLQMRGLPLSGLVEISSGSEAILRKSCGPGPVSHEAGLGAHFQKARFFHQAGFQLQAGFVCTFVQQYFASGQATLSPWCDVL